jgi:two-component system response regulator MprA
MVNAPAHTRRVRTQNAGTRIAVGDLVFDREARRVWCAGVEVELSRTEEAVFDCLFWHFPNAVDLNAMTHFVWGEELTGDRRHLLRVYIGYLRQKLKASRNVAVLNVRGVGYALGVRGGSPR